ncbi:MULTISPECIES: helix-turn-helix transcriptional regulator [unclassified Rhizobium]|uniref:helix-turn-helix transcriptional regulator n=1 Tax=unclassified Rhizobium TaxID=2613769 RepID=UPI00274049CE|nr:helix-turn-helix transcriptional regulator [Rhizobium sp. AN73]MDH7804182.1 AraC family transcriptional activator of pobA [Rhizobium sp. AN70]
MPLHKPITGVRKRTAARMLNSSLRVSEVKLASDGAHLILLASGEAHVIRGENNLTLSAPAFAWLPTGPTGQLRLNAGSRGSLLTASEIGLAHAMPTGTSAISIRNALQRILTQVLVEKDQLELAGYLETIANENLRPTAGSDTIIASLLSVTLIRICQHATADAATISLPGSLTERFVLLVAQHKRDQWDVEDYARYLGVSRERLGTAVRKATGLAPQAYIHRELLSEARDLLLNSSLQVAEIAFRLGFQDPGYFNRFFTRNEGISPGRFRRTATRMQNVPPPSYAAWP